jgi:predicted 3-demethylubiquinone-9 3-methyltransferase (glyoxalase superfamily)
MSPTASGKGAQRLMNQQVFTFLMFDGRAEEAMTFYVSLFKDAEIVSIQHYGQDEFGKEGTVMKAQFTLAGQQFICIDSPVKHDFTFTPAISIFVNCVSETEVEELFAALSKSGKVFMPLGEYPFSPKYAWLADRYGVSWQLNFTPKA